MSRPQETRELWIALRLPALPLEVFARGVADPAQPFAVVTEGSRPQVVIASRAARRAGLAPGQAVATALALAPGVALVPRDQVAELRALGDLATFLTRFTPQVSLEPPCSVLAAIAGSLKLFGGLARLTALIVQGFAERGHRPRMGIAPTPLAAHALARAGITRPVLAASELPALLAPLPLAMLDIDPAAAALLAAAGVQGFGELAALPRDALARRCGPGLPLLCDRALGLAADTRKPYQPPPRFEGRLALPVPVHEVEALGFAAHRLVNDLAAWLLARGLGAERLDLLLHHEPFQRKRLGTPATGLAFAPGSPSRSAAHLFGVLRERLARIVLPAPVEALTLVAARASPLAGRNLDWLPGHERDGVDIPLADRLRARLGDEGIGQVLPHPDHRPERACRMGTAATAGSSVPRDTERAKPGPPRDEAPRRASPPLRHGTQVMPPADAHAAAARRSAPPAPRPVWLLPEPQPIAAQALGRWKVHDKDPERIESGWWDGGDVRRDYFVARSPCGGLAWIYRDHSRGTDDGDWFLHGWFA